MFLNIIVVSEAKNICISLVYIFKQMYVRIRLNSLSGKIGLATLERFVRAQPVYMV